MDVHWNGLIVNDYEDSRPTGTPLEWGLYSDALVRWPRTLMGLPLPYGTARRPGVVDTPVADHDRAVAAWHRHLDDPDNVHALARRTDRWVKRTRTALALADAALRAPATGADRPGVEAARNALADATTALTDLTCTHIVNWLLPEQAWSTLLTDLLGADAAQACLAALLTPDGAGHLLSAHTALLDAADLIAAAPNAPASLADDLAHRIGPLLGTASPAAVPAPGEHPDAIRALLTTEAASGSRAERRATVHRAQADAAALRDAWRCAALLAAAGNPQAVNAVQALAAACHWAASCEERRNELRDTYLATVRRWCRAAHLDPRRVTPADLTNTHPAPAAPRPGKAVQ